MYRTMNERINMEQSSTTLDVIGTRGGGAKERGNIITSIMRWQQLVSVRYPEAQYMLVHGSRGVPLTLTTEELTTIENLRAKRSGCVDRVHSGTMSSPSQH